MTASPTALYRAWTTGFVTWFAAPGTVHMRAEVGEPFYFETHYEGARHPHYGRFLTLTPDRLVQLTWLTGQDGTKGAETVVSVELTPAGTGTHLRLNHAGFLDKASRDQHADAWPVVLTQLDNQV
jgi:uncharacterized protein YndB with AHSA1/START domain